VSADMNKFHTFVFNVQATLHACQPNIVSLQIQDDLWPLPLGHSTEVKGTIYGFSYL